MVDGIGASAGGLEAFKTFFRAMPSDSGMAFVLVQHLDPDHPSALVDIVHDCTAMQVLSAEDGAVVGPNRVYVMPPDTTLRLEAGMGCRHANCAPETLPLGESGVAKARADRPEGDRPACTSLTSPTMVTIMTGAEGRGDRPVRRRSRFTLACARAEPLALCDRPMDEEIGG